MQTLWRVIKGALVPENSEAVDFMRAAHFRAGDLVSCVITKPRSTVYMSSLHKLAKLLAQNTDHFHGWREHDIVKHLQVEAKAGCNVERIDVLGETAIRYTPKSLGFDTTDEAEFRIIVDQIVDYVAANYWPEFDLSLLDEVGPA